METTNQIEVRSLKSADFFEVAKILAKIGNKAVREVRNDMSNSQAGMLLFMSALEHAHEDTMAWFASLVNKTREEFGELGFDAPVDVVEQLIEKEDMKRFFERVRALTQKFLPKQ